MLRVWREAKWWFLAWLLALVVFVCINVFFNWVRMGLFLFSVYFLSLVVLIVLTVKLVRVLRKCNVYASKILAVPFKWLFAFFMDMFFALLRKLGNSEVLAMARRKWLDMLLLFQRKKGLQVLRKFRDESEIVFGDKKRLGSRLRKMHWRLLKTNRERVRFIYIAFLKKQIKAGVPLTMADTPNELVEKTKKPREHQELVSLYNFARYKDEAGSVSQGDVKRVMGYASRWNRLV